MADYKCFDLNAKSIYQAGLEEKLPYALCDWYVLKIKVKSREFNVYPVS